MSNLTGRYRRVRPSDQEVAAYLAAHPGARGAAVYRLECLTCGQHIWGSGLGIGAHERGAKHNNSIEVRA